MLGCMDEKRLTGGGAPSGLRGTRGAYEGVPELPYAGWASVCVRLIVEIDDGTSDGEFSTVLLKACG